MRDLHWSDPEFLEWEQHQIGEFHETEMTVRGERLVYFRCDRVSFTGSRNFAGAIVSIRIDTEGEPSVARDAMRVNLRAVPEEDLKEVTW